ncbi:hypothetical protein [Methylobacterium radiodurans]|uniref:Uncharacterized protein n=1 Tax=Methylobacterium radiodurans TaxID=2202828 RepID=A0A2U8VTG4_9HYPH|nr:hypothetical protein [Methylobacterium radiodurans]AWN37073.1 hypothetical protein DK427_16160 [Methylobacterium radiodurans]
MTKTTLLLAASLSLLAGSALAQGGSPYNASGSQAGGPLGGMERRSGAPGGTPAMAPGAADPSMAPAPRKRTVKTRRSHRHR